MARLRHSELKVLSEALLELYKPGPNSNLPERFFTILRRCFAFDYFAYHEIIDDYQPNRNVIYPEYRLDVKALEAYFHQHLTWNACVVDRVGSPVKISDFATIAQWQRTDLYNYIFRPYGQNHQLAFITQGSQPQLGIALNRSTLDFSEEERSLLGLLKPHLDQAFRGSRLFTYLSDAAESRGQAWIVADGSGRILFETGKAVHWLVEYFGHNGSLPTPIRDWLKRRASGLKDTNGLALTLQDFSVRRGTKQLIIRSLSPVESPEQRLFLTESNEELDPRPLLSFGLTKREAEVLLWISQGKRNSEIAEILGAGSRTIGKHLERIFVKLGVETRTAAANMALEVLRSSSGLCQNVKSLRST
jgi:DNA-binding CsgD family transcriptional regulator